MENTNLHPLHNYDGHMNTRSGIKFNFLDPKPEQIHLDDIAAGLSFNSHFGGQTPQFFSIAQHCLLVVELLPSHFDNEMALMALFHDSPEAYIGDMIKPLKIHFPKFKGIEDKILSVIAQKFELNLDYMGKIKEFDLKAQEVEYNAFYKGRYGMHYMDPDQAYMAFRHKYFELIGKRPE